MCDHTLDRSVVIEGRQRGFCFVDAIKRFAELGQVFIENGE
ncbi:hypothetical protein CSE45_4652 [Citreicella sp. SE45]|nr:hypothetical protein CSE45_4652 [Citreicella sp. SE45]